MIGISITDLIPSSFEYLNNVEVPLFMRWGNNNEMIEESADDLVKLLNEKEITESDIIAIQRMAIWYFTNGENYDKTAIVEEYCGDLGSGLFIFPDDTANMIDPTFVSSLKTGFFDTDGYMILQARYDKEDYDAEVKRLSSIECTVDDITIGIKYDDESYALPAYVAIDGFDYEYEYALLDEKNHTITYIILSYPEYVDLSEYEEYLKLDADEYKIEDTLNQFSIYERYYKDGVYIEYSDEN